MLDGKTQGHRSRRCTCHRASSFTGALKEIEESIVYLPRGLRKLLLETALEMSRYADPDTLASIEKGGALVASKLIKLVMGTSSGLSVR